MHVVRACGVGLWLALAVISALGGCGERVPVRLLPDWELELAGKRADVHLPAHLGMGLQSDDAVYHLVTRVTLDDAWRGQYVTLCIPVLRAKVQLFVDGHEVPSLDDHSLDAIRTVQPHRFRLDPLQTAGPTLSLDLQVTSNWVQGAWHDTVPRLALGAFGDRWTHCVYAFNVVTGAIAIVSMLTLSLIFGVRQLFSWRRRGAVSVGDDKDSIFARLVLGSAIYPATQLGLFQPILGRRDIAMLIISFIVIISASVELARRYVGLPRRPRWVGGAFVLFCVVGIAGSGSFVPAASGHLMGIAFVLFLVYFASFLRRYRSHPAAADLRWIGGCWIAVGVTTSLDMVTLFGGGAPFQGIEPEYLSTIVFGSLLGYRIARDYRVLIERQVTLNQDLAGRLHDIEQRNTEIGALNIELQRKVGDRSRELATALRRVHDERRDSLPADTLLGERYRVVRRLGAGAMGEVYEVLRLADGLRLAAKVVRGRVWPDTLARFTREAELAASIEHPNVVRVLDVDATADGELFFVMELVEGRSLEEERPRFGDHAYARVVLRQIASALHAIHAGGVVHRDLKPANILVTGGAAPIAKVADFGIAGTRALSQARVSSRAHRDDETIDAIAVESTVSLPAADPASPQLTAPGVLMGTPLYMAPELLAGREVGPPADLYSFGLIAYQLLVGGPLDQDRLSLAAQARRAFPILQPPLPPALANMLSRCLHDEPTQRPTAEAIADALAATTP